MKSASYFFFITLYFTKESFFSNFIRPSQFKIFNPSGSSNSNSTGSGILSSLGGIVKNLFGGRGAPKPTSSGGDFVDIGDGIKTPLSVIRGDRSSNGSTGLSSIFGEKGFGNNVGTYGVLGAGASILGGLIGGRAGGLLSGAGSGLALGASIGSIIPGIGTAIGAGVGAAVGFFASLFGGDPKKKKDKKENLPALNKGFTDALAQLRSLGSDKNAFYQDPESVIAKALEIRGQIAGGFGISFLSKKYQKESQSLIASKLAEADGIIAELNKLKSRALRARDVDTRLQTSFTTGVYLRDDQMSDMKRAMDFKRRNGMLSGTFTGIDNLPSMLAKGEMVLNPMQIQQVILNAGGDDPFKNAKIPGYSTGAYITPSNPPPSSNSSYSSDSSRREENQPITIQLVLNNSGMVKSDIEDVLINGLKKSNVQVEVVNAYDKGKSRTK